MVSYCSFIQSNGSGFGICKSCQGLATGSINPDPTKIGQNRGLAGDNAVI